MSKFTLDIQNGKQYWVADVTNNKYSLDFCPTLQNVQEAEDSNINCTNCTNCRWCTDCKECTGCRYCTNCEGCVDCNSCRISVGCCDCRLCLKCSDCKGCDNCIACVNCVNSSICISARHTNNSLMCTVTNNINTCVACTECQDCSDSAFLVAQMNKCSVIIDKYAEEGHMQPAVLEGLIEEAIDCICAHEGFDNICIEPEELYTKIMASLCCLFMNNKKG